MPRVAPDSLSGNKADRENWFRSPAYPTPIMPRVVPDALSGTKQIKRIGSDHLLTPHP